MAIHAFISSRLDYCNSLYVGIDQSSLRRLQLVQNAAARLLTNTKKREHITPVLVSLHWLPVHFRVNFKVLLFVFKSLHGLAPPYLAELVEPYIPARALRSADMSLLRVRRTNLRSRGDRAFAAAAPKLWNDLPFPIRNAQSIGAFKSLLKTHLFSLAFNTPWFLFLSLFACLFAVFTIFVCVFVCCFYFATCYCYRPFFFGACPVKHFDSVSDCCKCAL